METSVTLKQITSRLESSFVDVRPQLFKDKLSLVIDRIITVLPVNDHDVPVYIVRRKIGGHYLRAFCFNENVYIF